MGACEIVVLLLFFLGTSGLDWLLYTGQELRDTVLMCVWCVYVCEGVYGVCMWVVCEWCKLCVMCGVCVWVWCVSVCVWCVYVCSVWMMYVWCMCVSVVCVLSECVWCVYVCSVWMMYVWCVVYVCVLSVCGVGTNCRSNFSPLCCVTVTKLCFLFYIADCVIWLANKKMRSSLSVWSWCWLPNVHWFSFWSTRQRAGHAAAQWLRHCATNRKVAGSIPDIVFGIFHWHNPSRLTMALGFTQPLTEMSTRSIFWRIKTTRADNFTTFMYQLSWNLGASTSWNPQGLSRPVMGLV
jgi:hypothetical protein